MRRPFVFPICAATLVLCGCPKRQAVSRLVYVPSPPRASEQTTAQTTEAIVIEEPTAREPEAKTPEAPGPGQEPAPKRTVRRRRPARPDAPGEAEADQPAESTSATPAGVPALEPRGILERQAQLRREILATQEDTQKRMAQLDRVRLAAGDRKTLDDARAFLAQAARELEKGELVRSMNLARKAALLVSAVEQTH